LKVVQIPIGGSQGRAAEFGDFVGSDPFFVHLQLPQNTPLSGKLITSHTSSFFFDTHHNARHYSSS
jgi:hypothetical protein